MKKFSQNLLILLLTVFFIQCSEIEQVSFSGNNNQANILPSLLNTESRVFGFATDFQSSGQIYEARLSNGQIYIQNSDLENLGSSGVLRSSNDEIIFLADGYSILSSDNYTTIDIDNNFTVSSQFSLSNGVNPKDIITIGNRAFYSLYNPIYDIETGTSIHVIEIDLTTGETLKTYSFSDFVNVNEGFILLADDLIVVEDKIYVALQTFSPDFSQASTGFIGVIDVSEQRVENAIELRGRNPFKLAASDDNNRLFVANLATFDYTTGNYNTNLPYGGIEIVNLETQSVLTLMDDEDLGGFVENVVVYYGDLFAVVTTANFTDFTFTSSVLRFSQFATSALASTPLFTIEDDIQDIYAQDGYLWISTGVSGSTTPGLHVIDLSNRLVAAEAIELDIPIMSMTGF